MAGIAIAQHVEGIDRAACRRERGHEALPGERAPRQIVEEHDCPTWTLVRVQRQIAELVVDGVHAATSHARG